MNNTTTTNSNKINPTYVANDSVRVVSKLSARPTHKVGSNNEAIELMRAALKAMK